MCFFQLTSLSKKGRDTTVNKFEMFSSNNILNSITVLEARSSNAIRPTE